MNYFIYILFCSDKSLYVGVTSNLDLRIDQHNLGVDPNSYTYNRRPVRVVYREEFKNVNDAIERERQLHGWSRKKKIALIQSDYNKILGLSNHKNNSKGFYSGSQTKIMPRSTRPDKIWIS